MNGNIYWHSLASVPYSFGWCTISECNANAIPPEPPGKVFCSLFREECEPIFVQSYINAYNTAFNQPFSINYQKALNKYHYFSPNDINSDFINGTFGSRELYTISIGNSQSNIIIHHLQDEVDLYSGTPYLFVSAGSGGGSGFMYLDWIIVTYGVPYVISVS